jgi:hypothetical protein
VYFNHGLYLQVNIAMTDIIKTALGSTYCMFYHPAFPIAQLIPVQTLTGSCSVVNQALDSHGTDLLAWPAGLQDEITRLLWVNQFYQNLNKEPIRKPLLIHRQQEQYVIDCGDTRLMTLQLNPEISTVSVVTTCTTADAVCYQDWQQIASDSDLIRLTRFDTNNTTILVTTTPPGTDYGIEWLEIGDHSTGHHLHSIDLRLTMMQNYLDAQVTNFKFDNEWVRSPVDWLEFV